MRETLNRFSFSELPTRVMVGLCAVPSLFYNVAPHVNDWISGGITATAPAGTAIMQLLAVMMLFGLSISIARANWTGKIAFSIFGVAIILLNFMNILDATYAMRGNSTHGVRATIASADAAKSRIGELERIRAGVPQFHVTSEAQVDAGRQSVSSAMTTRDLECKSGVAERCRARGADVIAAQSHLLALTSQRTLTAQAEKLDTELAQLREKLAGLGPLPQAVDETSAAMGELAGLTEATVIKWRPRFMALMAELFCLFGPSVMRMWMAGIDGNRPRKEYPPITVKKIIPAADTHALKRLSALPSSAVVKKVARRPPTEELASVEAWMTERTIGRRGHEVRAADCHASYMSWCKENGVQPVSKNRLGRVLGGEMKVERVEKGGRNFYRGIAFKGASLRVVSQ